MDPADPRRRPALRRYVELSRAGHGIEDSRFTLVPFGDGMLPTYCLDHPDPVGTVVMFAGFDSLVEELLGYARLLHDSRLRVVAFDGPGQGTALEEHGLKMTPDWHLPVAAILDHFGIDDAYLFGLSLGGCLAIRAAAREPRVSRVVCDDVMTSLADCVLGQLPTGLRLMQGPGGRSSRIRLAVIDATLAALAGGDPDAASVPAIAAAAGVSPSTIYRRWPDKADLIADALATIAARTVPLTPTGTLRDDLVQFAEDLAAALALPDARAIARTMIAHDNPAAEEVRRTFWNERLRVTNASASRTSWSTARRPATNCRPTSPTTSCWSGSRARSGCAPS